MAHHEEEQVSGMVHEFGMTPLTWWLAGLAGTGLTLMLVAAGVGVITGGDVGIWFVLGLLMMAGGIGAWIAATRPFENFDNIDVRSTATTARMTTTPTRSPTKHGQTAAPAHHWTPCHARPSPRATRTGRLPGAVIRHGGRFLLLAAPSPDGEALARSVVIRYGVRYLEKHFLSLVPGLIALERGEMFTGRRARFRRQTQQRIPAPRSTATSSDGADEMKTVKWLDVAEPLMVLAYASATDASPVAVIDVLVGPEGAFSARMLAALPRYDSLDAVPPAEAE
ncbi:MAG: hypothetical protein IPM16_12385 [Chloroflexi bacterium]|nr:hypothetical protein [Chloroflexota bacterium]